MYSRCDIAALPYLRKVGEQHHYDNSKAWKVQADFARSPHGTVRFVLQKELRADSLEYCIDTKHSGLLPQTHVKAHADH